MLKGNLGIFNLGKKTRETVGLDIGNYSIKVVSILKDTSGRILTAYNIKNIPIGTKPGEAGKLVQEALGEVDIRSKEVNLSVSGSSVIVRFISLPKMSKEQLENAMIFEAEKYMPFSVNEVIMDFSILDDAAGGQMNVLLAAAKKDFIQSRIELLERLGLEISAIDVNAFALFNAFSVSNTFSGDKGTVFLDLGYSQTNILIVTKGVPRFMRLIQIGGKDIIDMLAEEAGITADKAEEQKLSDTSAEKVQNCTTRVMDELVKEIKLSLDYFENKYNMAVGEIYCSGGLVYQKGLIEYLQEKLGNQLMIWDPLKGLDVAENLSRESIAPVASRLTACIGLALRD